MCWVQIFLSALGRLGLGHLTHEIGWAEWTRITSVFDCKKIQKDVTVWEVNPFALFSLVHIFLKCGYLSCMRHFCGKAVNIHFLEDFDVQNVTRVLPGKILSFKGS